ncbi:MAG: RHS repeat-associated core domain-containing protein [Bacteroidota bacterium]
MDKHNLSVPSHWTDDAAELTSYRGNYRYGFNGKEQDKETVSTTTCDYGLRIYNPALGRFLSVDPIASSFPWYTSYQFAGNSPLANIDLNGEEPRLATIINPKTQSVLQVLTIDIKVKGVENFSNRSMYLDVTTWANKIMDHAFKAGQSKDENIVVTLNFIESNNIDPQKDFYIEFTSGSNFFSPGNSTFL